ncbi:hypothetical protein [Streptomyces profundus]|uniref:hypothetical protein n=1 Tax=Streptomyces profundus TaxID=2867410 RepID=UPI001D1654B6|nr:hypothetical protein [Streptomyces sp. MA3_2.13]UED83175.1 hypothetical protein K4G22_02320 [Streptomyces sp. MA3_2.13]
MESCTQNTVENDQGKPEQVSVCTEFSPATRETVQAVESADFESTALRPLPDWCLEDPAVNAWRFTRDDSCGIANGTLTIRDSRGNVVGLMTYLRYAYLYSDDSETGWGYQIEISPTTMTGATIGSSVQGSASCSGETCEVLKSTFPSQPLNTTPLTDAQGESFHEMTIGPDDVLSASSAWTYYFTSPAYGFSTSGVARPYTDVRCDNAVPDRASAGCILPDYTPTLLESLRATPLTMCATSKKPWPLACRGHAAAHR